MLWAQWCEAGLDPDAWFRATPRNFQLIVAARFKARFKAGHDAAIMAGWWGELLAREKKPKPLAEYLKPVLGPEQRRDHGAARVAAMFDRMAARQARAAASEGNDDDGAR